jgi:hypothetical protein
MPAPGSPGTHDRSAGSMVGSVMMSSVSKGRDVPSAAQLGEVLKMGERLRIREGSSSSS